MKNFYLLFLLCSLSMMTAQAQTVSNVITGLTLSRGVAIRGNDLYASDQAANRIVKADLSGINQTGTLVVNLTAARDMAFYGDDLYVGTTEGMGIVKIDVSSPTPAVVPVVNTSTDILGLLVIGDELYYCELTNNRVMKINLLDATPTPTIVATVASPTGLAISGNQLFIARGNSNNIYTIENITEPNPTAVLFATVSGQPFGLALNGNFLYTSVTSGLVRLDISQANPTAFQVPGVTFSDPYGTAFNNGIMYVADGTAVKKVEGLAPSFSVPDAVCNSEMTVSLGGASPTGGVYSGTGVTDDGNGQTFTFDIAGQGIGSFTVTYTLGIGVASTTLQVVAAPTVTFSTGGLSVQVDAGVQTGLGGGMPAGGVYSGNGVTDNGNGMTYSFNPATAGEGDNVITYTYSDANGCGGAQGAVITVTAATVPGDLCAEAIDLSLIHI